MIYNYSNLVDKLLAWYDENKRDLRWRRDPKPYYVWVSEIMLQQTRVEAVKDYFDRFIEALPTIEALAMEKEDKLMKLWEGLGYYNRVRNLQKAAVTVMSEYNGELPQDYEALLKLSGIGSYTAGAIASIAYDIRVPAVDGNVLRVTKRIAGSFDDISKASVKKELEQDLKEIMPERAGDFNQSLMELGATICIPNGKPLCEECPVKEECKGYHLDIMLQIPVKPAKKPRRIEEKTVILMEYQSKYAIHQREKKGLLAGLWELPNIEGVLSLSDLEDKLAELGIIEYDIELLGKAKHIFSHIEWRMLGYQVRINKMEKQKDMILLQPPSGWTNQEELVWVDKNQLKNEYALPTAFEAYKSWNLSESRSSKKDSKSII